jgi:hypothetical protein
MMANPRIVESESGGAITRAPPTHARTLRSIAKSPCILIVAFALIPPFNAVRAQHASDDPMAVANDAFGLTLGLESIGMYGPGFVRGFSPQVAGNVRIDGLCFDQQGSLSNRVVEDSTVRIGVNETGCAFPAPTGIVDYELRHPGNGTPSATVVASARSPTRKRVTFLVPVIGFVSVCEAHECIPLRSST